MEKLNVKESSNVVGGASLARCGRMIDRYSRRDRDSRRLMTRIAKNCAKYA